jgi:SNF2 family DNA or RNA helicase
MLQRADLHEYQRRAIEFIHSKRKCGAYLDMGLGKSIISLSVIKDLTDACIIRKTLIIAPLRVCQSTWKQESALWRHTRDLRISVCTGTAQQRKDGLNSNADVFLINKENVSWLVNLCSEKGSWPYGMIVIDESSCVKNHSTKIFRSLKKVVKHSKYVVLLSGTPAPNSLTDLWSQIFLIDGGASLGKTVTNFRNRFCEVDFWGHTYTVKEGYGEKIQELIKPMTLSMQGSDYLELPDRIDIVEKVVLPEKVMDEYKAFEKNLFLEFEGVEIEALSAAVLANKLLQYSNGAIYTNEEHDWTVLHDAKIDVLKELVEENASEALMVAYNYRHDIVRLQAAFPSAVVMDKRGMAVDAWNRGEIKMLLVHPQSASFGLNLQQGGSMLVWFGLTWSLEGYQQLVARLWRQGQERPVRVVHLVAEGTIDSRVMDVLKSKDAVQSDLLAALR